MKVYTTVGQEEKKWRRCVLMPRLSITKPMISPRKINQLTDGKGVDVILDIVGGPYF